MICYGSTKILRVFIVGLLITIGFVLGIYAQTMPAQAIGFVSYGGWVVSFVPPTVPPLPPCPAHSIVRSAEPTFGPALFGVYVLGGPLYDYGNLYAPDTPLIGGYEPIPFPTCPFPYPVFPIFFDGMFFLTGTGLY
jgi:hypothetical protein